MKFSRIFAVGLLTYLGFAALPSAILAEEKTPTQAYLEYQAAVQKATSLAEVLPRLSAAYRAMLESHPKKEHPVWLERLKQSSNIKDLKITKETISGDKCALDGNGTSARGNSVKGKVNLVKEGGAWKLDEEFWAT
jgi:hypothetical protein